MTQAPRAAVAQAFTAGRTEDVNLQRAGRGRTCCAGCSSTGSHGTACRLRRWLSLASEAEALRGSLTAPILWTLLLREQIKNAPPNELAGRLFE